MTILRSSEVAPKKTSSSSSMDEIQPLTPAKEEEVEPTNKSYETTPPGLVQNHPSPNALSMATCVSNPGQGGLSLRRSARLSSKLTSSSSSSSYNDGIASTRKRKPKVSSGGDIPPAPVVFDLEEYDEQSLDVQLLDSDDAPPGGGGGGKEGCLKLRSGKKLLKPPNHNKKLCLPLPNKEIETTTEVAAPVVVDPKTGGGSGDKAWKRFSLQDKKKGALMEEESGLDNNKINISSNTTTVGEEMDIHDATTSSRKEKGKEKLVEEVHFHSSSNRNNSSSSHVKSAGVDSLMMEDNTITQTVKVEHPPIATASATRDHMERFKNIARRNASRFAYFSPQEEEEEEEEEEDEVEIELPKVETSDDVEDWPGPFSTAMKIIKDRAAAQQKILTKDKIQSVPLTWVPKEKQQNHRPKKVAPSLQELCMTIIAENVDAITSLENVPDVLRHKLTHLLCDSRNMNNHFFDLLAGGSPSEIRIKDCSWLSEEQFTKTFQRSDTSNLTVLQLDQCGRCLPDYVLFTTLAHLPSKLSALTNVSLKGACRLSDAGLSALVASAPALRSINLGCCSLLTSDGIIDLADKLGPILKELYIDECFGIDAIRILPALLKLEHLEVLSISRFETVNDSFIRKFVAVGGKKMKELVLADCTKLTDKSLKAIAESCPGLCAIDLTNLSKLTDTAIGHLANGCQTIQTMKFCRNSFSDEAVAAYIEACGEPLKELSLNHVDEVGHHTALSLAKHARNLLSLDLSWCRNMTNEALGLIVDSCATLKMVKLFGCTQITNVFLDGHSNEEVRITGLKESQILKNIQVHDHSFPLRYSSL